MIHEDEPIQPAHISYKDYKKIVNRNPKQGLILFLSVFFALLIVFLGFAKMMSPDVDITLGDETLQTEEPAGSGAVDSRLKEILMEDNSEALGGEALSIEEDGKVIIPKRNNTEKVTPDNPTEEDSIYLEEEPKPAVKPEQKIPQTTSGNDNHQTAPVPQSVNAKVVVGSYSTLEQAEVAKGILIDSDLGLSPFIRKINNEYTIQVGSFNSKEKAMNAARDLLIKNYPARVLIEQ